MYSWRHQVQFYETDLMGIVHHSNYLRFFEEARVAWAHQVGIIDYQNPESGHFLAVLETRCRHLKPSYFGDLLTVRLQVKAQGVRICFQYLITSEKGEKIAAGTSTHASLNKQLRPIRMTEQMKNILEKETWTETWL
jgi:acyl-CoA thioester hydrolase